MSVGWRVCFNWGFFWSLIIGWFGENGVLMSDGVNPSPLRGPPLILRGGLFYILLEILL